jgi:hypothetical protein
MLICFLDYRGEISSPPHTEYGATAKIVPQMDMILFNMLFINMLQIKKNLRLRNRLAIPDHREQNT